jgi:hypothetical protein
VLLLNPPGKGAIIRDYYCSKTSRTGYLFAPIALLHAGAVFRSAGFQVQALDAIALELDAGECLERIAAVQPDVVFSLVGAVSVAADREFLNALVARFPDVVVMGCGDVLLEGAEAWVAQGTLGAAVLDFSLSSMAEYARGAAGPLPGIVGRFGDQILSAPVPKEPRVGVGLPPHELFLGYGYRYPFARRRPFAGVLTDFGCPFSCSFCVMSGLAYHRRPMDEVAAEIRHLDALGVREFMLWDQTFAAKREWALEFLDVLPERRMGRSMGWTCFTRPDRIDADLARRMAQKGCHTAIMGVETANPATLLAMRKGFTPKQAREAFAACHAAGISTVATIIVGLPGEGPADVEATMRLILEMDPDYLSVHTAVPRAGTGLREGMAASGLVPSFCEAMDQSGEECVLASDSMPAEEILRLRRSCNRRFYARPGYLARTALRLLLRPQLLLDQVRQGLTLLRRNPAKTA